METYPTSNLKATIDTSIDKTNASKIFSWKLNYVVPENSEFHNIIKFDLK